jgi:uncharacterized membrane protein YraQ (UPF0718 family)
MTAEILKREFIYAAYYFEIQFRQIFFYWILEILIGSADLVFVKKKSAEFFRTSRKKNRRLFLFAEFPLQIFGFADFGFCEKKVSGIFQDVCGKKIGACFVSLNFFCRFSVPRIWFL